MNKETKSLTRCDNVVDEAQGAPRVIFGLSARSGSRVIQKGERGGAAEASFSVCRRCKTKDAPKMQSKAKSVCPAHQAENELEFA